MAKRVNGRVSAAAIQAEPEPQVLGPEVEERLVRALRHLRRAVNMIDRREQCGEDCQHLRELAATLEAQLETYRSVYFPKGRKP